MNKLIRYITIIVALFLVSACEDYLDTRPDNMMTVEEIFKTRKTAENYLANVYKYLRTEINYGSAGAWSAMADEVDVTYADYWVSNFNVGAMTQATDYMNNWRTMYRGIRSATFFMENVDRVPTDDGNGMTEKLKKQYKSEARFLRAMFYFYIFRQYGPPVLLGDEVIAPDASMAETALPRATVSEAVNYIVSELNAVIQSRTIPEFLPESNLDYGRITESACRALKARVLLYAASDFYNTDINTPYKNFKDKEGKLLFDYTNEGRIARWQRAVDANLDVINLPAYSLFEEKDPVTNKINPYLSFKNLFTTDWNSEMIFGRPSGGFWETEMHSPRTVNGWSGWGPTQELVDIFYTKKGLPIDQDPSYSETGFSASNSEESYTSNNRAFNYTETGTYNMYVNREPRFYATISFDNSRWLAPAKDGTYIRVRYFNGGNSGVYTGRNYSKTGYGIRKHNNPNADVGNNKIPEHVEMLFRLGEIYLNYVEALNEVSYTNNLPEILTYLNKIRTRAGIPAYGYGVDDLPVPTNQEAMRQAIYRERRIELALEGHRYYDAIRWMTTDVAGNPITHAERDFDGAKHGMSVNEKEAGFHKRSVFETRVWKKKNNLFPIHIDEIYKDKNLVQNPFWDGSNE
jgi:hypothetical protein